MSTVLVVAHHRRGDAVRLCEEASAWLLANGHAPVMVDEDRLALDLGDDVVARCADPRAVDLAVSLGGDGTMLRAVALLDGAPAPIIGVNLGVLGYLTEVDASELLDVLGRWFAGEAGAWRIDERMMLEVSVSKVGTAERVVHTALNEAVIEKRETGHTVRMAVWIDGSLFTTYAADGLILATPTGSTAYSMSARGPVVSPRLRAMLLTPVSPHMLFDRTLVLDPGERVEVEIVGHRSAALSVDGEATVTLDEGDRVAVAPSPRVARFVRFGDRRFHQVLTAKFGLTGR
ncbi:MAG: NAD(+)/NADH kinase [Ilumatobacteraceae bacterium]